MATVSTSLNKFANSEVELRRVGGVNAPVCSLQFPVLLIDLLRLVTSDDIMKSWLKNYQYRSKYRYGVCLVSFQIVDRIRRQSSYASCEFCTHRRRRRDATRQLSLVGFGVKHRSISPKARNDHTLMSQGNVQRWQWYELGMDHDNVSAESGGRG